MTRRTQYTTLSLTQGTPIMRTKTKAVVEPAMNDDEEHVTLLDAAASLVLTTKEALRCVQNAMRIALQYRASRRKNWRRIASYILHQHHGPQYEILKFGVRYWYVDALGRVIGTVWNNTVDDRDRLNVFNVFLAEKLAAATAEVQAHLRRCMTHVVLGETVTPPEGSSLLPTEQHA